jgi:hypothetical protein
VETPHASQTQSPPTSEAAAEPGNKDSEQFDAGTPARMFLLLGLRVGLSRQVVGPETSWEISVMAFIVGSILYLLAVAAVESYWRKWPLSVRRPLNWVFNIVASIFILFGLYTCIFPI